MDLEYFDLFGEEVFCSICLEQIKEGQRTVMITKCNHGFHQTCLDPWLGSNKTCPNCRGTISQTDPQAPTESQILDLDRTYITYVLYSWILQTFPGNRYKQHNQRIHEFLVNFQWNGRRPIAFSLNPRNRMSLSAIRSLRTYLIQREETQFHRLYPSQVHHAIHRNPRVRQIRNEIQEQLTALSQRLA